MNTKQFVTVFMAAATIVSVNGLGELTTVMMNGALTIPLISASAGTLGTALAVLGAMKIGAAALFLAAELGSNGGGILGSQRQKRAASTAATVTNPDALFGLIAAMDTMGCGKQLVCELEAKPTSALAADELLMLSLFGDRKSKHSVNPASAKAEYDLAADLGLATKSQVVCRQRYSTCPFTADEMMDALRQSNI